MNRHLVLPMALLAAAVAVSPMPAVRGEVVGNWDFSSESFASLTGTIGLSELRTKPYYGSFGGLPDIPATEFVSPASFGISGPGGASKTVLRVPNTAGYGPMGGLIAEFPRRVNATANSLNRYTIVMDVLVRQAAYDDVYARGIRRYMSLFQTGPTSDGDLFIEVRDQPGPEAARPLGVGGVYDGNVAADQWHRIAWVATLDAPTSEPRFRSYVNGQPAGTLVWDELAAQSADDVKRDLTDPSRPLGALGLDGRFSIATLGQISDGNLPDFDTSVFFLFNDDANEVGEVFMAHLQFRDDALSPSEVLALGGVDGQPITAVPEPASLALAAVGLGAAALIRSYRSRSTTVSRAPPFGTESPA